MEKKKRNFRKTFPVMFLIFMLIMVIPAGCSTSDRNNISDESTATVAPMESVVPSAEATSVTEVQSSVDLKSAADKKRAKKNQKKSSLGNAKDATAANTKKAKHSLNNEKKSKNISGYMEKRYKKYKVDKYPENYVKMLEDTAKKFGMTIAQAQMLWEN